MFTNKPIGVGAIVAIVAMLALALGASSASATRITPANENIKATNSGTTKFIPENAFAETSIQCKKSTVTGTTPTQVEPATQNNTNRTGTGTRSTGPGSVIMPITPTFEECGVYTWNGTAWVEKVAATTTVSTANGNWTFAALRAEAAKEANDMNIAAFGVPKAGASIEFNIGLGPCTITVSPADASAVTGIWTNNNPSSVKVDGQIRFTDAAGCSGFNTGNPAQFEATYTVVTTPGGANVSIIR